MRWARGNRRDRKQSAADGLVKTLKARFKCKTRRVHICLWSRPRLTRIIEPGPFFAYFLLGGQVLRPYKNNGFRLVSMENLGEFLSMGGHAAYIWPSYAIVFAVLVALLVTSWRGCKRAERDLETAEKSMTERKEAGRHEAQA